ncbi:hypothetical protein [Microbacterium sp. H83]|uniref:hypothetical protein n=1 Tax=Microbacterium sp. H83 TaxID=1827324 RepID=UPI0007F52207|nr:hypothetical protein [Microbacterium sp. H83]OAN34005.1 hypothetical protein A4X16_06020 [Microbacterium sp. H83]
MSTTRIDAPRQGVAHQPRWFPRRRLVLLVTLILVPFALAAVLNSYGPPTAESAVRMAFATVAGQTVAIGGALAALVITIVSRRNLPGIVFFGLLAVIVTANAVMAMTGAGQLLLDRLDLVAAIAAEG